MNTPTENAALAELLHDNPHATAAWLDHSDNPPRLMILLDPPSDRVRQSLRQGGSTVSLTIPAQLIQLPRTVKLGPSFHDLRCPVPVGQALNVNQECQDEPVQLGTQLQPAGANWVGTAGAPVKWPDQAGKFRWGILSNWHVMFPPGATHGHRQHQPDVGSPAIARLTDWSPVPAAGTYQIDAAIADAQIDGLHTISDQVLDIGPLGDHPIDAAVGLAVIKSGRTTGLTAARCSATGAAVKVSYGGYTATFVDQDIYQNTGPAFSAPGDSGSCIIGATSHCPASLLFAGGGDLTVGNPFRYIVTRFDLRFPFP